MNYQMVPFELAFWMAIVLPWLEVTIGTALLFGVALRGAAALSAALLFVFICAQSAALARGLTVDCGCGLAAGEEVDVVGVTTLGRTTLLLAAVVAFARLGGILSFACRFPKKPRNLAFVGLVGTISCSATLAPATETYAQDERPRDAAFWYRRAAEGLTAFSIDEMNALVNYLHSPQVTHPAWVVEMLDRARPLLADVKIGATRREATLGMGLELRESLVNVQTPLKSELLGFSLLLWADALTSPDSDTAARSVAAMYQLSLHQVLDTPDNAVTAMGAFMSAGAALDQLLDQGRIDAPEAATVAAEVRRFPEDDPFRLMEAEVSGRRAFLIPLRGESDEKLASGPPLGSFGPKDGAPLNRETVEFALAFLDDAESILGMPDREDARIRMAQLVEWAQAHPQGAALSELDRFNTVFDRAVRMSAMVDQREARLRDALFGMDEPNAAALYRLAIAEFQPTRVQFWLAVEMAENRPGPEALLEPVFLGIERVLTLVDEASRLERCDFGTTRSSTELEFLPVFACGLHDLLRANMIVATYDFKFANAARAIERVMTALRVARHLSVDPNLLSGVVAHHATRCAILATRDCFGDAAPEMLAAGGACSILSAFVGDDPFGQVRAIERTTIALGRRIALRRVNPPDTPEAVARAMEEWSAEQLYIFAMYFATLSIDQSLENAKWREPLSLLQLGLNVESLEALWGEDVPQATLEWLAVSDLGKPPFSFGPPARTWITDMHSVSMTDWRELTDPILALGTAPLKGD